MATPAIRTIEAGANVTMRKGSCLCGSVQVTANLPTPNIGACHCGQCRTWTGGSPYYCLSAEDIAFEDESAVSIYAASEWGERGFCGTCGSPVFWRVKGKPANNLAVGLFADQQDFAVASEIFVDRRAPWQSVYDGATQSTEAEEIAKFDAALKGDTP